MSLKGSAIVEVCFAIGAPVGSILLTRFVNFDVTMRSSDQLVLDGLSRYNAITVIKALGLITCKSKAFDGVIRCP